MCSCDHDPAVAYKTSFRVARKAHKCIECGRQILAGELYRFTSAIFEPGDRPSNLHTCIGCSAAVDWLDERCGRWVHHGILTDIESHFERMATGKLGGSW